MQVVWGQGQVRTKCDGFGIRRNQDGVGSQPWQRSCVFRSGHYSSVCWVPPSSKM